MLTTFRFGSDEKHVREALTAAFKKRGVDLAGLDTIIQTTMVAAALSTGVEEQVERLARVARIAEQFDLSASLKREMVVKAYASYAESLAPPIVGSPEQRVSDKRLHLAIRVPLSMGSRNLLRRKSGNATPRLPGEPENAT